jgi:hypothetical protein
MSESYILNSLENNEFKPIKELTEDEFNRIDECVWSISDFNKQFLIFIYFQLNLNEFDKLIKGLSNIPVTQIDVKVIQSKNSFLNINSVVFNLLASFSFYLDSSEAYLKRKFGGTSAESISFIKETEYSFDNSFAYRFLSKLRNYSQHIGFPIHGIPFEAIENIKEPQTMKGDFKLIIGKDLLLKEKGLLGNIVYNDLLTFNDDIDVKPLIYELSYIVSKMEKLIYTFHKEQMEKSIRYIENVANDYKTEKNQIIIMYNINIEGEKAKFDYLTLPFDEITEIKRFNNWHN